MDYCFDTRYTDIVSSSSGLYPREAFHRLASPQTSFGVRSSRIHFSPTDGFSYKRVAQFNLEWIFSKLDSGFLVLDSGFHEQKIPGFRNPDSLTRGDLLMDNLRQEAQVFIHTLLLRENTITWKSKKSQ